MGEIYVCGGEVIEGEEIGELGRDCGAIIDDDDVFEGGENW